MVMAVGCEPVMMSVPFVESLKMQEHIKILFIPFTLTWLE